MKHTTSLTRELFRWERSHISDRPHLKTPTEDSTRCSRNVVQDLIATDLQQDRRAGCKNLLRWDGLRWRYLFSLQDSILDIISCYVPSSLVAIVHTWAKQRMNKLDCSRFTHIKLYPEDMFVDLVTEKISIID